MRAEFPEPNFTARTPIPMKTITLEIADSHYFYAERLAASLNEPLDQLLHRALIEKLDELEPLTPKNKPSVAAAKLSWLL